MAFLRNSLCAVVTALLLVESFFHFFVSAPDVTILSLSARKWYFQEWKPLNDEGYRDAPYSQERFADKKLVVVLGDSIASGHGISPYQKRFSGVLQDELGDEAVVVTLAQPGWDLAAQLRAFAEFSWQPDLVVLSAYYNDLENIAATHNRDFDFLANFSDHRWIAAWTQRSYAISYVYWSIVFAAAIQDESGAYAAYLRSLHSDDTIWEAYAAQARQGLAEIKSRGAKTVAVLIPMLYSPEASAGFDTRVRALMSSEDVPLLDVGAVVADMSPIRRIVGRTDSHPGAATHARIGRALAERIQDEGLLSSTK